MGAEARILGHGGVRVVARAAGKSEATVRKGVDELEAGGGALGRVRRRGGGRKRASHPFSGWFGIDAAGQRLASIPPLWTVLWYRSPVITPRRPYRTDLSAARWALIEPLLSQWRAQRAGLGIAKIQHDLRE